MNTLFDPLLDVCVPFILEANGPSYRLKESKKRMKRPDSNPESAPESTEDEASPETE